MSFGISIGDLIKLGEVAGRVYKNCRDCTGDYKSLTTEARSLTNLLGDIQDKYDKIPPHKRQQIIDAYNPCVDVLSELDRLLVHYHSLDTKSRRAWDRVKWDPEKSRSLRERLASSVAMLNAFYTSLVHDNQVLILEALERLESDYRGGYREESIASIERVASRTSQEEEDDGDAAWIQIIRDLEDVGISQQVAMAYHDFVVEWFIKAINEGRLLEDRNELENLSSTRKSSDNASDMTCLSIPRAVACLGFKQDLPCTEDQLTSKLSPIIVPLQRSDSSDAPEPLHVSEPRSDTFKMLRLTSSSSNAPEPIQLLPQSTQAPESLPVASHQYDGKELARPTAIASEAPESLHVPAPCDLNWRAQQILAAWTRRDFATATKLLGEQLAAVERGSVTSTGLQPDRRVLRHCIGVCASFCGNLTQAKHFFESAFNGIYLSRDLDDGDIAAARWLGDVCLQLGEFHNAVLAWSVALEGSIKRYGLSHDRTRHVAQEMYKMDEWTSVFSDIDDQFCANVDPTNIFSNTHALEKSGLVRAILARVYEWQPQWSRNKSHRPTATLRPRPRVDLIPGEAFLTGPLVSLGAWPLQWDPTFVPMAVYQTKWHMRLAPPSTALVKRSLRTNSLGDSKKLDHVTKGESAWLVETVKAILRELGIEHADHPDENAIVCSRNRSLNGFASSDAIFISFWKLQFRNVYGLKISDVKWSTRKTPAIDKPSSVTPDDTVEFRDTLKELLGLAEAGANRGASRGEGASVQSSTRSWTSWAASKKA